LILTALFSDHRTEIHSEIRDYARFGNDSTVTVSYNVFCTERFQRVARQAGFSEVLFRNFDIGIDLPRPARGIGTFTEQLTDGRRLQVSGGFLMPWKFAALRAS
jgi:hypothetical protein